MSEKKIKVDWSAINEAPMSMANVVAVQASKDLFVVTFGQYAPTLGPSVDVVKLRNPIRVALPQDAALALFERLQSYFPDHDGDAEAEAEAEAEDEG